MTSMRLWLPLLLCGCLLGAEAGDFGFEDGEACEEEEQCLKERTCSWVEGVCRPSCLDTEDCDDGRVCIVTSEGEVLEDYSIHWDGCVPEGDVPTDLPEDICVSILDDSAAR